jgi:zinc transport system substrate-binding protein
LTANYSAKNKTGTNKIKVVTTLFPLYDMAKNIGGNNAEVTLLLPPGVEAHSFEPKPSDIVKINEADIFIYTGKSMEPWAEDIKKSLTNKNLFIVDSSQGTKMIPVSAPGATTPIGPLDPHIWLDFSNAKIMVQNITQAFMAKDNIRSSFYQQNADNYSARLSQLDSEYRTPLATCQNKQIIYSGHYAFGYVASRYGLSYSSAQGPSPDSEPTASDLEKLVDQIRQNNIQYIFYEELASSKIAQTITHETNAKMLLLNAAHNVTKDQLQQNVSFFDIMENDLNNLKVGLQCQ